MLKEMGWPEDACPPMESLLVFLQSQTRGPAQPTVPAVTPVPTATLNTHQPLCHDMSAESCTPPPHKPTTSSPSTAGPRPSRTQKPSVPSPARETQGSASATRLPTSGHKRRARTNTHPKPGRPTHPKPGRPTRCCGNHVRAPFSPLDSPPHRCHTRLISLLDFLPCFPSSPLVTCRRHSSYLAPCATSTRYRAISHRHDSPSATLSSAYIYSPCTYCI